MVAYDYSRYDQDECFYCHLVREISDDIDRQEENFERSEAQASAGETRNNPNTAPDGKVEETSAEKVSTPNVSLAGNWEDGATKTMKESNTPEKPKPEEKQSGPVKQVPEVGMDELERKTRGLNIGGHGH
ncbi:hypothetical protein MMC30_007289 [Trapelia coarctata]|nr:hypothetical protein [Trapelia coarctata]